MAPSAGEVAAATDGARGGGTWVGRPTTLPAVGPVGRHTLLVALCSAARAAREETGRYCIPSGDAGRRPATGASRRAAGVQHVATHRAERAGARCVPSHRGSPTPDGENSRRRRHLCCSHGAVAAAAGVAAVRRRDARYRWRTRRTRAEALSAASRCVPTCQPRRAVAVACCDDAEVRAGAAAAGVAEVARRDRHRGGTDASGRARGRCDARRRAGTPRSNHHAAGRVAAAAWCRSTVLAQ